MNLYKHKGTVLLCYYGLSMEHEELENTVEPLPCVFENSRTAPSVAK